MFEHVPEVVEAAESVFIEVIFASDAADTLEHFNPKSSPSNRTNHINCISFPSNILTPSIQNIPSLLNINI